MGLDAMIFIFWMLSFKPAFSLSSFTSYLEFLSKEIIKFFISPLWKWLQSKSYL